MAPRVVLSKIFTSDYGHTAQVDGTGFLPNIRICIHTFYPSGKSIGGQGKSTDSEGNFHTTIGHWSSAKEETGKYTIWVYYGEFRSGNLEPNTIVKADDEVSANFDLPYQRDSLVKIDKIEDLPWGGSAVITGSFESKNERPNGTISYSHKEIYFTGTLNPAPVYTNEYGRFQAILEIPKVVQSPCVIQAHFKDDGHFKPSDSNVVYYNIIKHECLLSLTIDNLRLRIQSTEGLFQNDDFVLVKQLQGYRLKVQLIDKVLKLPISFKHVNLVADFGLHLSDITVGSDGTFELKDLTAPTKTGKFIISASFEGDHEHMPVESNEVALVVLGTSVNRSPKAQLISRQTGIRKNIVRTIAKTCRSIDLQAMVIKKNDGIYHLIVLKVRLTKQNLKEVEEIQYDRKLKAPNENKFRIIYDYRDINELNNILEEIMNGEIKLCDISAIPMGNEPNFILDEGNNPLDDIQFTSSREREEYPHRILASQMDRNAVTYVEEEKIYYQKYSKSFDNLGYFLGIRKLNTQNNIIIALPYYCKFINLSEEESKSYITKIRIHEFLIHQCTVSFEMIRNDEPYLDSINLDDGVLFESNEPTMKDILIPRPNLEGVASLEIRVLHDTIGEITSKLVSTPTFPLTPHTTSTAIDNLIFDNLGEVNRLLDLTLQDLSANEESDSFEKKASMRYDYDNKCVNKDLEHEIAKAVTGLMNCGGGLLVIGVNGTKIVGLKLDFSTVHNGDWDKWVQRLGDALHAEFEIESIYDNYYKVTKLGNLDDPVAVIRVGKAPRAVWMFDKAKNGKKRSSFYVRRNNQTVRLEDKEQVTYIQHRFSE